MNTIAFAGFRHGHIFSLYDQCFAERDRITIAGAWEEDKSARAAAQREHGVFFDGRSYDDLLADPRIDIIAIGDYYGRRGELCIRALEANKHVIVDKPLCTNLSELDKIERLSMEKQLKVGCMLSLRYSRYTAVVKDIISSGRLGDISAVSFNGQHGLDYGSRPMWYFEEGKHGGVINDIAIHGIDLIEYLTGERLTKIDAARTWNKFADKAPSFQDCAQFMIRFGADIGVQGDVSYAAPCHTEFGLPFYWQFLIWGTKGVLRFAEDGKGVDAFFDYTSAPQYIEGVPSDRNHIRDFLDEIAGIPGSLLSTPEVIASSRDTLLVQKAASERRYSETGKCGE